MYPDPKGVRSQVFHQADIQSKVWWPARYPSITGDSWLETSIISTAEMAPLCDGTELRNPNEATANKSPQPPSSRWNPHELIPNHPRQCTGGEYITGSREGTFAEITNFQKIAYCGALQKGAATFMVNGACRRDGLKSKKSLQDRNTAWECTKRKKTLLWKAFIFPIIQVVGCVRWSILFETTVHRWLALPTLTQLRKWIPYPAFLSLL